MAILVNTKFTGTVDSGSVEEIVRHRRGEVDVRQIDPEREEREREDDRKRRTDQVNRGEFEEDRERECRVRNEHHHEGRDEHEPTELERGHREGVARGNRHENRQHQGNAGVQDRVAEPRPDDAVLELHKVVPVLGQLAERPEAERQLAVQAVECRLALRRRKQQPRQGQHEEHCEEDENGYYEHASEPARGSRR